MILKYQDNGAWCYIDKIDKSEAKYISEDEAIRKYDEWYKSLPCECGAKDPAEYMNGVRLPDEIVKSDKVFSMAVEEFESNGFGRQSKNLIDINTMSLPITAIALRFADEAECILVTNQRAYLMNDKGQTIDRLS